MAFQVIKQDPVAPRAPVKQPFQSPNPVKPPSRLVNEMRNLSTFYNVDAQTFMERNKELQASSAGRESHVKTEDPPTAPTVDEPKISVDPSEDSPAAMAMLTVAQEALMPRPRRVRFASGLVAQARPEDLDPSQYKDAFENPSSFGEAWNHPDPFQRDRWRAAIIKELKKMEDRRVRVPHKIKDVPPDKRLVQHKWVLEIKRNGIFRARLVAKGFTQVGGSDFDQIFSPMINDITFRLMLVMKIIFQLDSSLLMWKLLF